MAFPRFTPVDLVNGYYIVDDFVEGCYRVEKPLGTVWHDHLSTQEEAAAKAKEMP